MRHFLFGLFLSFCLGCSVSHPHFEDIEIAKPYFKILTSSPVLMKETGVKVIKDDRNNRTIVVAVESTVLDNLTPAERLRAEKVCRTKALARLASEEHGVSVFHYESLEEKIVQTATELSETASSESNLLSITNAKSEGMVKNAKVVGHWSSKDRSVYYLAVGFSFSNAAPIHTN